ncbi:MAG: IS1634 family transposase [bacterium]|nr:IS1634 family transposase [bacterium]
MYLRQSKRRYKGKTYASYVLVESVRTPKGPRQKTVCTLGDLGPRSREDWLKLVRKVEAALCGQGEIFEPQDDREVREIVAKVEAKRAKESAAGPPASDQDLISVDPAGVGSERHRAAGPVHVGHQFWQRLGLDRILVDLGLDERACKLSCAMVLNRLIAPSSEHAMPAWFRTTALQDILGLELDDRGEDWLYANMDKLEPHRRAIEQALAARERSLFNLDRQIYLYDVTSTYFEGQAEANPKAKLGHSRDKRPDCKQVLIGLALGREGFPLGHEIFAGNRQDRSTLGEMLDRLEANLGLRKGATVVVDRGMAFDENLEEITSRGLHYLVAMRQSERDAWLAEFADEGDFAQVHRAVSPTNPAQRKSLVKVKSRRRGDQTHVLCHSSERVAKDRAIRDKQEARLTTDLERLKARIDKGRLAQPVKIGEAIGRLKERYPRVARYWRIDYQADSKGLTVELDQARHEQAAALDGCYLLKTDRTDLEAEEVWRCYSLLTQVEAAFRSLKSPLAERPIFHQIERRVDTHIFLALLAYHLLIAIETTLRRQGCHSSWASLRQTLSSHQVATIVLPTSSGAILRIRKSSTPEPEHREIYRLLDLPERIIKPVQSWSESPV